MDIKLKNKRIFRLCRVCGGDVCTQQGKLCYECGEVIKHIPTGEYNRRKYEEKQNRVWKRMAEFGVGKSDIENMRLLKTQLKFLLKRGYITQEEYDEYQPMFDILKTYTQVVAVN